MHKRNALQLDVQIIERDVEAITDRFGDHQTNHDGKEVLNVASRLDQDD